MARAGINYQNVLDAIADCQGRGIKPTADNCRAVLGTGSKTTINNYLKRWRAEQDFVGGADTTALPTELVDTIKNLWERLCADSQQQVELAQQEWEKQRGDFQQQRHEDETVRTVLQEKLNTANAALAESQQEFSEVEQKLKHLNLDHHQQTADLATAEQRFADRQTEIERLSALVKHVQDNLTHYQQEAQALREQQQLALDKLRQEHTGKLKILETECAESRQQLVQKENENTTLADNLEIAKADSKTRLQSETQLKHDLQIKSAESLQLGKQVQTLECNLDKSQKTLRENEKSLTELMVTVKLKEQILTQKETTLKQQEDMLAGVIQNLDEAKAENAYLKGQLATLEKQLK